MPQALPITRWCCSWGLPGALFCLGGIKVGGAACPAPSDALFLPASGAAVRHCDEEKGWLEPDLFNCTSPAFKELSILVMPCCMPLSLPKTLPAQVTTTTSVPGSCRGFTNHS